MRSRQHAEASPSHLRRNDTMGELRGVNVFPEAVGAVVVADARTNGEYVCIVERTGAEEREEMTVMIEVPNPTDRARSYAILNSASRRCSVCVWQSRRSTAEERTDSPAPPPRPRLSGSSIADDALESSSRACPLAESQ